MFIAAAEEMPHHDDRKREDQELSIHPGKTEVLTAKAGIGLAHDQGADHTPLDTKAAQQLPHADHLLSCLRRTGRAMLTLGIRSDEPAIQSTYPAVDMVALRA